jgi:hypothetical protein
MLAGASRDSDLSRLPSRARRSEEGEAGRRVTGSFTHFSATREEKDGTIRVAAVPNPEIIRMLESAEPDALGFGAVGPCLVNDDTTYSYLSCESMTERAT